MTEPSVSFEVPQNNPALSPGLSLCDGQFTLTDQIGMGGFGLTYKALDNVLNRTVVIKECFPEDFCMRHGLNVVPRNDQHADQFESIVRMFMHEARSLAKLRHPHIVGVHRAFEENNTAYMVLDLIEGEDLLDVFEKRPESLTPQAIHKLLLQLLDAIETVHEMDLLHRDIAPDNIMIDPTGMPVLIDFGAARGDASRKTRLISSLLVVKDGYSPQEFYVAGSPQSPASDLFALAATFYHLLTGDAPLNSPARMIDLASKKPDPCKPLVGRVDGYPKAFLAAIDKALQVMPADRLQSAAQWRAMVSEAPKAAHAKTGKTADPKPDIAAIIGKPLTALIAETNADVSKTRVIETRPEPPAVAPPPRPKTRVPDWVAEFNEETIGDDDSDATADATPCAQSPQSTRRKTTVKRVPTRVLPNPDARPTTVRPPKEVSRAEVLGPPDPAPNAWVKPVLRMSLLGTLFGILVVGATNILMNGGI